MIRTLVALGVGICLAAGVSPARADVVLTPDDVDPKLHLKATKEKPLASSRQGAQADEIANVDQGEPRCDLFGDSLTLSVADAPMSLQTGVDESDLTEGAILEAVREIGLPSLRVRIQPGEETLVNVPTIFYTEPEAFRRSIDLLGFDIDLVATPVSYRWFHGDGTSSSTDRPGRPYPAMDVTYRYPEPAEQLHPRVDVTYQVRFRVDGGSWQTIGQTLLASGPTAELEVREAAPVLTTP
jgi:hypothetical protein